jgi:hypothetical protein
MLMAKKVKSKRGPVADRVKIDGNWKDAMAKALKKKRPAGGFPKDEKTPKE